MSQNALLDCETATPSAEAMSGFAQRDVPIARVQREHLTLVDWDKGGDTTKNVTPVKAWTAARPARHRWFGPYEAGIVLLLLSSAVAGAVCLLRLG